MNRSEKKFTPHPPLSIVTDEKNPKISLVPQAIAVARMEPHNTDERKYDDPSSISIKKRIVPQATPLRPTIRRNFETTHPTPHDKVGVYQTFPIAFRDQEDKNKYDEECYRTALISLENIQNDPKLVPHLIEPLRRLILKIKELKGLEKTPDLTEAIEKTVIRLKRPNELSHETYQEIAYRMHGHPSKSLQILGGLMIGLGVVMAVVGFVFFVPLISGLALSLAGIGLFAYQRKPHGLAKAMTDVNIIDGSGPTFAGS